MTIDAMTFDRNKTLAQARTSLLLASALWWWAGSVFSPWAESMDPRLWLYDTLFYLGFVLLALVLVAAGVSWMPSRTASTRRVRSLAWLGVLLAGAAIAWVYDATDIGLRFKVNASADALAGSASLPYETPRHRAGHFLIDTVREPVPGQAWLWLGKPFGGGTGTSRALVRSGTQAPTPPAEGAYRFRPIAAGWWMAEQVH